MEVLYYRSAILLKCCIIGVSYYGSVVLQECHNIEVCCIIGVSYY